ncbi:MAG TPA: hypothetical protein VFU76_01940 [Terriglobales bacterium]|nr:hypothetical protein [Terriglobales bacterium]
MERVVRLATLSVMLLLATAASAQRIVIRVSTPVLSRGLSGTVSLAPGVTARGALVEECGKDWGGIESVTLTDAQGHFDLPDVVPSSTHYLRVSLDNGERLLVKVEVEKQATGDLRLSFLPHY